MIVPLTLTIAQSVAHAEDSLRVGDIVFNHIDTLVFRKVAEDTNGWANHVGIIIDVSGKEPTVAESKFPFSTTMPLSRFIKRSKNGRVEIKRFVQPLSEDEQEKIKAAARSKLGVFYDTGFNLHSKKQFCSRFVYEVVSEATGRKLGDIETLAELFKSNPDADITFWKFCYFGMIPWKRETVTPASQLVSDKLYTVLSGQNGLYTQQH